MLFKGKAPASPGDDCRGCGVPTEDINRLTGLCDECGIEESQAWRYLPLDEPVIDWGDGLRT